ncbi:MAG: hypothetical protein L3J39_15135 [Verrucomicrobiales bacterium]|nr:hypothetical protein [Verrucomicrobiales bacterium]
MPTVLVDKGFSIKRWHPASAQLCASGMWRWAGAAISAASGCARGGCQLVETGGDVVTISNLLAQGWVELADGNFDTFGILKAAQVAFANRSDADDQKVSFVFHEGVM